MRKQSALAVFLNIFFRAMLLLVLLLAVGFGSYKGVLFFYDRKTADGTTGLPRQEDDDDKDLKDVIVTALYGDDTKTSQVDYMMVRIFNVNTKNMDYINIPSNTKVTLSEAFFEKAGAEAAILPEEIRLTDIGTYYNSDEARYNMTTTVIKELLGLEEIDYYETVNQETFVSVVNLIDAVEYDVPIAMSFRDSNGINVELNQGTQNITGDQALGIMRNTDGYADPEMGRVTASSGYLKQYVDAVHSLEDVDQLSDYYSRYFNLITTNGSEETAQKYLNYYFEVKPVQIYFHTLEGTSEDEDYIVDMDVASSQASKILANESYTTVQTGNAAVQAVSSKDLIIAVYNSTTTNGLAGKWQQRLNDDGYQVNKIDTYRDQTLEHAKIIVRTEGSGADLLTYFPNATIETGTLDEGIDIKVIIGTSDIF